MPRRFNQEIELEICARYLGGIASPQLAEYYSTSATTICNILKRHGIPRIYTAWPKGIPNLKSRCLSIETEREICNQYKGGQRVVELADVYEISTGTIYSIMV